MKDDTKKKWRPEGWKMPIGDFARYGKGQQWAFELGADEMLRQLYVNGQPAKLGDVEGVTVFIPRGNLP
jgi:hypothetical protein